MHTAKKIFKKFLGKIINALNLVSRKKSYNREKNVKQGGKKNLIIRFTALWTKSVTRLNP